MYAAVVTVDLDMSQEEASRTLLTDEIVPIVSASTGFVAGYWLEPHDAKGFAFVVFDTEENARAAAPPVGADMGNGVTVATAEFREIAASA